SRRLQLMCYSAQIWQSYQKYVRHFGADIDMDEFMRIYWLRQEGAKLKLGKAMDIAFAGPQSDKERKIREMIRAFDATETARLEQELFKQRKRFADAERTLAVKQTKAASESRRIATDKVAWIMGKLADLRRAEP